MAITSCGWDHPDPLCIKQLEALIALGGWIIAIITILFLSMEIIFERTRRLESHHYLKLIRRSSRSRVGELQVGQRIKPPVRVETPPPKVVIQPEVAMPPEEFMPPEEYVPPEQFKPPVQQVSPVTPIPTKQPFRLPPDAFSYLPDGAHLPERNPSRQLESGPYVPLPERNSSKQLESGPYVPPPTYDDD